MIKVLWGCILKLSLHSVNLVLILYRTGNMQSAILLLFVASFSLWLCTLTSTNLPMPCYISPYLVYNIYDQNCQPQLSAFCQFVVLHNSSLSAAAVCLLFHQDDAKLESTHLVQSSRLSSKPAHADSSLSTCQSL